MARRAQLYMTKVPLFVPFVELVLWARRSWGMGAWMQRALAPHTASAALERGGSQAYLVLWGCA